MTVDNPWATPGSPPPSVAPRPSSPPPVGVETRQMLLVLGATCLTVALAAGTALIWHALGPNGQVAVMLLVTAALLVTAVAARRLPATADALGAVGVAALLIDAYAGRSLHLGGLGQLPAHVYWGLTASTACGVLALVTVSAPRLWAPAIGAVAASLVATTAWVDPMSLGRAAALGPAVLLIAVTADRLLRTVPGTTMPARIVNGSLASAIIAVSTAATVVAAARHDVAAVWGALLAMLVAALPELSGVMAPDVEATSAAASGLLAAALAAAAAHDASVDARIVVVVSLTAISVLAMAWWPVGHRWQIATVTGTSLGAGVAYLSLATDERGFGLANAFLAAIALAVAVGWPSRRDPQLAVRGSAAVTGAVFASIAVGLLLDLDHVHTPEAYVATPAVSALILGAAAMNISSRLTSWVLMPGLVLSLLPSLVLALDGDITRRVVVLVVGAVLVVIGAESRLAAPLAVGAAAVSLIVLRVLGPEVSRLPHWVSLGIVGIVLLALGATWEARMLDIRRASHALRPRIAALR